MADALDSMSKALVAQDALLYSVVPDLKAPGITSPFSLGIGEGVMDDILAAQAVSAEISQMIALPLFVTDMARTSGVFEALGGMANIRSS